LTWKIFGNFAPSWSNDSQVAEIVGEVVTAERLHRHRIAAHHANGTGGRCGGFGTHRGTDQHAVRPVACFE
jgi:hypothetical protein